MVIRGSSMSELVEQELSNTQCLAVQVGGMQQPGACV